MHHPPRPSPPMHTTHPSPRDAASTSSSPPPLPPHRHTLEAPRRDAVCPPPESLHIPLSPDSAPQPPPPPAVEDPHISPTPPNPLPPIPLLPPRTTLHHSHTTEPNPPPHYHTLHATHSTEHTNTHGLGLGHGHDHDHDHHHHHATTTITIHDPTLPQPSNQTPVLSDLPPGLLRKADYVTALESQLLQLDAELKLLHEECNDAVHALGAPSPSFAPPAFYDDPARPLYPRNVSHHSKQSDARRRTRPLLKGACTKRPPARTTAIAAAFQAAVPSCLPELIPELAHVDPDFFINLITDPSLQQPSAPSSAATYGAPAKTFMNPMLSFYKKLPE